MNNVLMYSSEKRRFIVPNDGMVDASQGIFILSCQEKKYFLQSGNVIEDSSIMGISERIDHLNTLDKAELKRFYKERMRSQNPNPESRGAGLGLIEIARRASSKIEYSFSPYGEGASFFTMSVMVG